MFANRISSSTSCSIWPPETSPPSSSRDVLRHRFQSCNTSGEIAQFGWWFWSGKFPEEWAIQQLEAAIDFAGHAEPDHLIYEKLATLCGRLPGEAVSSVAKLLATTGPWQISAHEKDVRKVLEAAVRSGGSAKDAALKLVNALGARGILNFRDLLG